VKPVVHAPREGEVISVAGARIEIKTSAPDTNGKLGVIEYTAPPDFPGPPAHVHHELFEVFYVLDGVLTMELHGETITAPAGTFVLVPPETPHRFSNPRGEPTRFLGIIAPGGFEQYFRDLASLVAAGPPDPAAIAEVASRYDLENVV
jgi:mannose-6-phosphate isomerase-like protein (cupin superfamily)